MGKLDKKQKTQVAVMAVLSVGLFGYFTFRMIMPTPAAAQSQSARPADAVTPAKPAAPAATPAVPVAAQDAPPPAPGMRDPFQPAISNVPAPSAPATTPNTTSGVKMAGIKGVGPETISVPRVPILPSPASRDLGGVQEMTPGSAPSLMNSPPPLPVVPDAPQWTVTGVLQSGNENVAILRSGEARRIVRAGDMVDSEFRIAAVTRDAVVLRHGRYRFDLPLGGPKVPVAPHPAASGYGVPAAPMAGPAASDKDQGSAAIDAALAAHDSAAASIKQIHTLQNQFDK